MRIFVILFLAISIVSTQASAQVDVVTQHNDNHRSGVNSHETVLNHESVKTSFGKLWTLYSDAKIMAQPLYVSNLKSPRCPDGCNTVIFASMKGTLYAYMADQKPTTVNDTLVWARYVGDPKAGSGDFDMWATDDPWWGILGTPVIDRASNSIYAVVWNADSQYRLYNIALDTGNIKQGPVTIQGSVGAVRFVETTPNWKQLRKQRAALLLSNGSLYVAFGGDNHDALAGWLFVYDASTLALKTVWSPTPTGKNGGIWQSGQGPAADDAGNVYIQTGDGDFDASHHLYGDTMLRLKPGTNGITVADYFSPCNQLYLKNITCDLDQGSSGPLLFDDLVVGGGKNGELYMMRAQHLAHYLPGPIPPAKPNCMAVPDCQDGPLMVQKWKVSMGHIHGSPVVWQGPAGKKWLYVMGEGSHLKAYPFANGKFDVAGVRESKWSPANPGPQPCGDALMHWMPGGIMSVSSNSDNAGTGIVWVLVPANGDANSYRGVKGMLLALDAEDVSKELWRSQNSDGALSDNSDSFGLLSRFVAPIIANGKVFIPTAGDKEPLYRWCAPARPTTFPANYYLAVYGLKG